MLTRRAALITLAGTAAIPTRARAAAPLRIGVINPFSGPAAIYGDEVTRCYAIAVDAANAKGGVLGRSIELVRGDATTPQQGIAAVDQLATKDNVDLFSGTYISAISNSASDAALRYQKAWWETNALAKELTERGLPNYIRAGSNANGFATVTAQAITGLIAPALKKPPQEVTVWIEHEESIYGSSIANIQKQLLQKAGVKILGMGSHASRATDLTDSVLRAKQANPDVWVETGYVPDGNLLLRSARDQGFKPPAILWVGVGDTNDTLDAIGAEFAEGLLVVGYARADISPEFGPGAEQFLAAYRAKYNRDPIAPQGLSGYVGMVMLLEALAIAGSTDMEKLRDAAAKMDKPLNSYANGYGVKFDESFQNIRAFPTVVQWQSGKPITVFPEKARLAGVTLKNLPRV
jgi:branched-chain amino acid transport system substrate-binding protein